MAAGFLREHHTIMNKAVLDLETYYDAECSVRTLGNRGYIEHYNFDPYLMSVAGDDGFEWVGNPKEFDWEILDNCHIWAANASFDQTIIETGVEKGWWRGPKDSEWDCLLDLARFCGLPANLAGLVDKVLGVSMDKGVRDRMKGKQWGDMDDDFRKEVCDYALADSVLALKVVDQLEDQWTDFERQISRHTRLMMSRGLPVDHDSALESLSILKRNRSKLEDKIPWADEATPLSRKAFNEQCRKQNIAIPASMAIGDERADSWLSEHQENCPWALAVRDYRRVNALLKKMESFTKSIIDDRYYGGLRYFGATTGRFSGSGGNLNLQNLPRGEMFGVDLRKMISTDESKRLIVADLSQIEVRTLSWLSGDTEGLSEIARTDDIYEAFAVRFGLWDTQKGPLKSNDADLRHKVKQIVLGAGYGCSAKKFAMITGMSLTEAKHSTRLYKRRMPAVAEYWEHLEDKISFAVKSKKPLSFDLPSGRTINYGQLELLGQSFDTRQSPAALLYRNGRYSPVRIWYGLLAENLSQALARDVFADMLLRIEAAGWPIILHVHDEVVVEVDKDKAEQAAADIERIMMEAPSWIPDIPLATEAEILTKYTK